MRCLLESNKFWLALIVLITNFAYGSPELNIEQVAEIVCDSRMASINFKCHLEYGKIDMETTNQINKYKNVCSKVMKESKKKCQNSAIENCNLATDNMKKYCESKFKEIRNSRLIARSVIEKSCQTAFNVTKKACISEYMKLVKPKISKLDKFLKLVETTKIPKLTTMKPKIKPGENDKNLESIINSIFNENKLNISTNDMEVIFNQILSESENHPIKHKSKVTINPNIKGKNIESVINLIFDVNKQKLSKEDMAKFINHVLLEDTHSKIKVTIPPKLIKENKSKSKTLKISTAAKSIIDFIFGESQNKIKTDNLLGFIDEVFSDAEFDPTKPVKVHNKKPIVIPNIQTIINYIFGKNQKKIHRHLMISFIERILDPKYDFSKPIKIVPQRKPKIIQLNKSKGVPLISKPKHTNQDRFKPQKIPISLIKIPLDVQKAIDFIFGMEQDKMNKAELVDFINFIFSDVAIDQLKPKVEQKPIKIPSIQSVIKFVFGKNPKKINKQMLAAMIERIMDIEKMPKKLIREKLLYLQSGKTTGKPKIKIEKPTPSIQSIIDFIFGEKQKTIENNILVKFIKELFGSFHFNPIKPVKESNKPHLEMPENEAMINFIFGDSQKNIERPVLLAFIDKIINSDQYHSEVISLIKSNKISKPKLIIIPVQISKPPKPKKPLKKPIDKTSIEYMLSYIFGEDSEKLSKSDVSYCVDKFFKNVKIPKSISAVDKIFNNLKSKIEKHISLLFDDKSYANKLYMPLIVNYLLENYQNKIKGSPIGSSLSKLKSKPNFLKTLTKVLNEPKSKISNKPEGNNKPVYGVNILKPKPADKEKQEPFDVSFAFNIISQLLGDKNIPDKPIFIEEINKGNENIDKINTVNNSPMIPSSKIKSKLEKQKEKAIKNKLILVTLYKTFNKLFVKDSFHISKGIKDKDKINKILLSFPIKREKLEGISGDDKELIISLIFNLIDEIIDMLTKYSKSNVKYDSINSKLDSILSGKPSLEGGKPFDASFAFQIIDDLLDSTKNDSKLRHDRPEEDKIISIYDLLEDGNKTGNEKAKPAPEKGEIQLKPPGNSLNQKETGNTKNKLQDTHDKPKKDGEIQKPTKSNSKSSKTSKEKNLDKLKTTVKFKGVSKSKKVTEEPKKSIGKSKKTTKKPKKSTGKPTKTISKGKTTAKGKKTTAKGKKTTSKGKKTTAKGKKTTAKGKKTTAKGKKTTAKGKKTTAKGKKTTAKGKKTTAKGKKTTAKAKKTTVKPKKG